MNLRAGIHLSFLNFNIMWKKFWLCVIADFGFIKGLSSLTIEEQWVVKYLFINREDYIGPTELGAIYAKENYINAWISAPKSAAAWASKTCIKLTGKGFLIRSENGKYKYDSSRNSFKKNRKVK